MKEEISKRTCDQCSHVELQDKESFVGRFGFHDWFELEYRTGAVPASRKISKDFCSKECLQKYLEEM